MSLLQIENLSLAVGDTPILKGVELSVAPGEVMGLVGESGSGKSMTALTIMQLLPHAARATGRVTFDGIDILAATEDQMCALRGDDIGMVFQEPMTALNPVKTIGEQVAEGIRWHTRASRADAEDRARKMLDRVGLPEAKFPLSRYPHELSGGQRQRVVIAIACALKPKLLIADEPTTALDVVLQAQILDLLRGLVSENRMGLLLISHDLAVVTEMADRITILRHGEVMEAGDTARTLSEQLHPYTRQLALASMHVPARAKVHAAGQGKPLLEVEGVTRDYPGRRTSLFKSAAPIRAVDDVSLSLAPGQSVALVGRSGCGKSTLARMILALDKSTSGTIRFRGETITGKSEAELKAARRDMQVVFQDPYGSFDPRQKVVKLVAEPLHVLETKPTPAERREMVAHALHEVGLGTSDMDKYPHEFSGGQRQRLSIARAIITRPKLVVADEPVSALDVSIRAQILDLFAELNQKLGIGYLFITHDLTVARAITDEVLVMHDGRIVERGKTGDVLDHPQSEAARALVAAAPDLHRAIAHRMQEQG
ncbi:MULTISPECIES: dipeptide ABC transporter ATP-binding protein [unclassified Mesorhizobium]|uniref:ABC transporter ATP-binding protein n=1 Tax=unclassified Mesorhizobium TaxID=325217 RepID=UPI0003CE31E3|nr:MULTISPECIES: dipeptide ABC transporter ATP-binding protein [unclassified Mesorhizobium]ESW80575.1 microcin C ABC transporter ATP-binding protein YejF [Mesorhizobium sp. LSJC285A00]ESX16084.1 microcin C ABC transporter ATP-binding protein YejF [Mesorhizobium sp. LSJC255A00]ESX29760.1 microcin C ABC transporter ATP-binding protein YejF [Mesorhizobium sp. LSHC440B00]ESX35315.1 microcin C ABC transporter ATP-binding protein YejF [Mesorhizobium sp. LSHC432A00]ESX41527.1 microcin C ABC transport